MRDQVGYPKYINNQTRFEKKYHKVKLTAFLLFTDFFMILSLT